MSQQLSTNWASILQKQIVEKQHFQDQEKQELRERKLKYKQELETDMQLKKQQRLIQKQQDERLESMTLNTLQQREQLKLREGEIRKVQQIETSLENLNHQLITKKMTQERSYQRLMYDQNKQIQDRLNELKSQEKLKIIKEEEQRQLRDNYDSMISKKEQFDKQQKYLRQKPANSIVQYSSFKDKSDKSNYQDILNKQLEDKKNKLSELQNKKLEERQKIEQKLNYEKQKLLEHKIKDFQLHKQYEQENEQIMKNKIIQSSQQINSNDLKINWNEIANKPKLPHIYCENYQAYDRNKQLQQIDRDLRQYSKLQNNVNYTQQNLTIPQQDKVEIFTSLTPQKHPQSQSSKQSKSSLKPIKLEQQDYGYAQIHSIKTQTPVSKHSQKSHANVNAVVENPFEKMLSQQQKPKYQSYNILTGVLN